MCFNVFLYCLITYFMRMNPLAAGMETLDATNIKTYLYSSCLCVKWPLALLQSLHRHSLIFSFMQSVIKQGCGTGHYIELHICHQHEQAQRLHSCAFVHRRIYPQLVHVFRPRSFREH